MVGMDQKDRSGLLLCQGCIIPGCLADLIEVAMVTSVASQRAVFLCADTLVRSAQGCAVFSVPGVHHSRTGRGPH